MLNDWYIGCVVIFINSFEDCVPEEEIQIKANWGIRSLFLYRSGQLINLLP
jgi:hypothetical protein